MSGLDVQALADRAALATTAYERAKAANALVARVAELERLLEAATVREAELEQQLADAKKDGLLERDGRWAAQADAQALTDALREIETGRPNPDEPRKSLVAPLWVREIARAALAAHGQQEPA